jgi:SNF2 family DNA or RNA helicase
MLVIAPLKPCYLVWPLEVQKWIDFYDFKVEVLHGPKKDEALEREADIYVINPDGLDWLLEAKKSKNQRGKIKVDVDVKAFAAMGFDTLVLDELTLWKHHGSGRHKALKAVLGTFARRWGLTGTPVPNGLIDLFGQIYMLDMGRSFGPYITHFRQQYFLPSFDGFGWNLQKDADARIHERIRPLVLRLAAEDYVDMPMIVENIKKFELPKNVQKIYDELEADAITYLEGHPIAAANAAAVSTKLRQVASGGVYIDEVVSQIMGKKAVRVRGERDWVALHDEKTDMIEDLVEELNGEPLLVAYDFHHDLARLQKRFGKDVPCIGGGTSPQRATEIEALWNQRKIPLLLGHPQSMGHGLNLQRGGSHVAWYSLTWNLELYDQFNGRIARQGSIHKRVFVHHLLAKGTLEERIFWVLRNKDKTQNALLEAMKDLRRKKR